MHEKDLASGYGEVFLPYALESKYPNAASEWHWQYVFPSSKLSVDPRSGKIRRHHINEKTVQNAMKEAVKKAGIAKHASVHTLRHYAEFRTMPSDHISSLSMNDLFMINSA
jgi:integrase